MRKALSNDEKRNKIIGIKVKQETFSKLQYMAEREGETLSTFLNTILINEIDKYFNYAKIEWTKLSESEKKGINQ